MQWSTVPNNKKKIRIWYPSLITRNSSRARQPLSRVNVTELLLQLLVKIGNIYLFKIIIKIKNMETSLKTGFVQIFSCCPKNLSYPNFGGLQPPSPPRPVRLCSFESQTVVFKLFDFHLRKFKKFIIKKFYFHNQTCQHSTWQWLVVGDSPRGQLGPGIGQARIHTGFHRFTEIGRILVIKMLSKLKSGKCWTRLASYPLQYGNWPWWNNPAICKASSAENGT